MPTKPRSRKLYVNHRYRPFLLIPRASRSQNSVSIPDLHSRFNLTQTTLRKLRSISRTTNNTPNYGLGEISNPRNQPLPHLRIQRSFLLHHHAIPNPTTTTLQPLTRISPAPGPSHNRTTPLRRRSSAILLLGRLAHQNAAPPTPGNLPIGEAKSEVDRAGYFADPRSRGGVHWCTVSAVC